MPASPLTVSAALLLNLTNIALQCFAWQEVQSALSRIMLNHLHVAWASLRCVTSTRTSLPGIALAQRTTVTSCLSPSSLRLVSKDAGLSGWAGSCPALTTAGSMACKTLSRLRQERRVGGMQWARDWDSAEDMQTEWYTGQKSTIKRILYHIFCGKLCVIELAWHWNLCHTNPHFELWLLHFRTPRWHLSSQPFLLSLQAPREPEVAPPPRSLCVRLPSACDLESTADK